MSKAFKLCKELRSRYGAAIPFKGICKDEGILPLAVDLGEGINGLFVTVNGVKLIILNTRLKKEERRDWAWHELYHHFTSVAGASIHYTLREEKNATLFASLCQIPTVEWGDTAESLMDKFSVSHWLAKNKNRFRAKGISEDVEVVCPQWTAFSKRSIPF